MKWEVPVVDHAELRRLCREKQEAAIVSCLASLKGLSLDQALSLYYRSALARQINEGKYGIDNLDPAYLAEDQIENEPDLF